VKQLKIVRVCVSFGPIGSMPTIGMASVGSLHECDSTPLKGEGVQNALLHHTSIENRCTDHRLV
jgi:hypothetical protein